MIPKIMLPGTLVRSLKTTHLFTNPFIATAGSIQECAPGSVFMVIAKDIPAPDKRLKNELLWTMLWDVTSSREKPKHALWLGAMMTFDDNPLFICE